MKIQPPFHRHYPICYSLLFTFFFIIIIISTTRSSNNSDTDIHQKIRSRESQLCDCCSQPSLHLPSPPPPSNHLPSLSSLPVVSLSTCRRSRATPTARSRTRSPIRSVSAIHHRHKDTHVMQKNKENQKQNKKCYIPQENSYGRPLPHH